MRLLFLFITLPFCSIAQINIYNVDLLDSSKKQLYLYTENNLKLQSKLLIDKVKLGTLEATQIESNRFVIYPNKYGKDTLRLYRKGKMVYQSIFRSDLLPNAIVRIGHSLDTMMSIQQIVATPYLNVIYPNSNYKGNFNVWSFQLTIEKIDGDSTAAEIATGNQLSTKQLVLIRHSNAGDKLHFMDIRGGWPNSRTVKFPPFIIVIR